MKSLHSDNAYPQFITKARRQGEALGAARTAGATRNKVGVIWITYAATNPLGLPHMLGVLGRPLLIFFIGHAAVLALAMLLLS